MLMEEVLEKLLQLVVMVYKRTEPSAILTVKKDIMELVLFAGKAAPMASLTQVLTA